jgi:integration host factor subunit alpha
MINPRGPQRHGGRLQALDAQFCLRASDNAADKIMSHRTTTRADLLEAVYGTCPGLSRAQARDVVEQALDEICHALVRGETVKLRSFGAFSVRAKRARVGRNPKTGEEYPITARRVLTFRPSPRLISAVNGEESPEDESVLGRALSSTSV